MARAFLKVSAGCSAIGLLLACGWTFTKESTWAAKISTGAAADTTADTVSDAAPNAKPLPREIGRIETVVLHDQPRKKDLQCRVTYPSHAATSCPIVIFSHGALGSKDAYDYLIDYLAGHGYVCIQPTHADAMASVPKMMRLIKAGEVMTSLPHDAAAWDNRARDISLIVDSLSAIEKQVPVALNFKKIACAGHSLGAFTSALVAGAVPPRPATRKDYLDKRITAAIMMSPQGVRHSDHDFGFGDGQAWQHMVVPCLFFTGTLDSTKWTTYKDRSAGFTSSPPGDKYLAVINGAAHMTFAGLGNGSMVGNDEDEGGKPKPFRQFLTKQLSKTMTPAEGNIAPMLDDICKITTCFLDAYLKQEPQAKTELITPHSFGNLVDLKGR